MDVNETTIVIADGHPLFRAGLSQALAACKGFRVAAGVSNGTELCLAVKQHNPDVVITDLSMPVMNGWEAIRYIKQHSPGVGIVALSMHVGAAIVIDTIMAGAHAYLVKTIDAGEVEEAVRCAKQGKTFLCAAIRQQMADMVQHICRKQLFCSREREIAGLLFLEYTTKEIAKVLSLSERTVEDYRKVMLKKTGSKNGIGIVKYAIRNGLVDLDG